MDISLGTPKNLKGAIVNALLVAYSSPGVDLQHQLHTHIKDYLSQHLGAALLTAKSRDVEDAIVKLSEGLGIEVQSK